MNLSQVLQMIVLLLLEKFGPYLTKLIEQLFARIFPNATEKIVDSNSFAEFVAAITQELRTAASRMRFPFNRIVNWLIDYALAELWNRLISANVIMGEPQPVLMQAGPVELDFSGDELESCLCELPAKSASQVFHT